jgi:hypothetical protein
MRIDWVWLVWLTGVFMSGAVLEIYALLHPDHLRTLSFWIHRFLTNYPAICASGAFGLTSLLAFHFWRF